MADVTLNIVIPDAVVSRVQTALGATTKAQAEAWVKQQIKGQVISYEATQARNTAEQAVETARQAQQDAEQTAADQAAADISL